jgi:hypothetical protein
LIETCVILHNYLRTLFPGVHHQQLDREDRQHNIIPGEWRRGRNMTDIERVVAPNAGSRKAKKQRLLLKHYLNSDAGLVPWQMKMI